MLLPILIGANFIEYKDKEFLDKTFTGRNTDFGAEWYSEIGVQIVTTMIVFIFEPFIDIVSDYVEIWALRWYHRNFVYIKDPKKYDKNDFLKYLDLEAGPEYSFHHKLANTNCLVFICLIFGPMLPLLYPIGMFALFVQYMTDKYFLAYFYRLPPKYSS
jgi:hypothetical protein